MYKILIKRFRNLRRMTQKTLSEKSGISESYLSHLEADNSIRDRTPNLQVLESISISLSICPRDAITYPCIECQLNQTCTKKQKNICNPEDEIKEILNHYI